MYENKMTENGQSTTKTPGQEQYQKLTNGTGSRKKSYIQYDYRHPDGELFSCVKLTLEACRTARDEWLDRKAAKEGATA